MRNLLAFVGAVVLTVACAGWFLGWYTLRSTPAPAGHRSVNVEFDTNKIGHDIHRGEARLQELLQKDGKDPGHGAAGDPKSPKKAPGREGKAEPSPFGAGEPSED
jgi:hypothetical protein